jgi:chromosome partitioning protein
MAKTIAICNQKGGVAKTTTSVNVSTYLAIEKKKTLLIDLDPQSNATSGVGIDKHSIKSSIYNVLHEHVSLENVIMPTQIEGLFLAPSNIDLTGAEVELVNAMSREYRLKKAISMIKDSYDFIIVDCPPSLGLLTVNALSAADSIIIPIQCEYYALEGLSQLMNTVNLIKENLNIALHIEGVILTMADYRNNLTKEVIEEVRKYFGDKVYNTIIPRSIKLTEAPGFGKPIALYDKHSIGATAYHNVVKEMLGIFSQPIDSNNVINGDRSAQEAKELLDGKEVR